MNKKYFQYLFQKGKLPIIFFAILYVGIVVSVFALNDTNFYYSYVEQITYRLRVTMTMNALLALVVSYVLPFVLFSYVHRKRSVDTYFALPISRKEQLITNIVFAFMMTAGLFVLCTLYCVILSGESLELLLRLLCVGVVGIFTLLLVNSCTYLFANNIFDGIVITAAYSMLPVLMMIVNNTVCSNLIVGIDNGVDWISTLTRLISPVYMFVYSVYRISEQTVGINIIYIISSLLLSVIAMYGLYNNFIKRKTERAESVSDRKSAYPFIIHVYLIGCLSVIGSYVVKDGISIALLLYVLLLLIAYVVSQFVYRRKIALTLNNLIVFVGCLVLAIGVSYVGWQTKGFGIAYQLNLFNKGNDVSVNLREAVMIQDGKIVSIAQDYGENTTNVNFEIKVTKETQEENKELVNILRQYQIDCIDAYYNRSTNIDSYTGYYPYGYCSFSNGNEYYSYYETILFTQENLEYINQYTPVYIFDSRVGMTVDLKEFLNQ